MCISARTSTIVRKETAVLTWSEVRFTVRRHQCRCRLCAMSISTTSYKPVLSDGFNKHDTVGRNNNVKHMRTLLIYDIYSHYR